MLVGVNISFKNPQAQCRHISWQMTRRPNEVRPPNKSLEVIFFIADALCPNMHAFSIHSFIR